jgi:hypothetical protein
LCQKGILMGLPPVQDGVVDLLNVHDDMVCRLKPKNNTSCP